MKDNSSMDIFKDTFLLSSLCVSLRMNQFFI